MPETEPHRPTPEPAPGSRFGRPLWEMELLVSGALLFSLFRLPGPLQGLFLRLETRLSEELFLAPFLVLYLGNLVVLALIACFSAHFLLRSFWVALAGLNEVFPDGVRWRELDQSPIQKREGRAFFPSTHELEERVDRIASTIFSVLFFVILQLLFVFLALGVTMALLAPLGRLVPGLRGIGVFWLAIGMLYVPLLFGAVVDRWFKGRPERLERHPRLAAAVGRVFRGYYRLFFSWLYTPIQLTFASHFSTRKTSLALAGTMMLIVGLFVLTLLAGTGALGYDSYVLFPERGRGETVEPAHYETLATGGRVQPVPTIQSEVVAGPYVRLFIPYRPQRDAERLAEVCPGTEPLREEGFFLRRKARRRLLAEGRRAELLGCLGRLYEIELDGELRRDLDLSFYRHPGSGLRGLLAMIPTAGLGPGRHLLVVRRPPSERPLAELADPEARRRELERRTSYISFWR